MSAFIFERRGRAVRLVSCSEQAGHLTEQLLFNGSRIAEFGGYSTGQRLNFKPVREIVGRESARSLG